MLERQRQRQTERVVGYIHSQKPQNMLMVVLEWFKFVKQQE